MAPTLLDYAHSACVLCAFACLVALRAKHLAGALAAVCTTNLVFFVGSSWQVENALAFVGPCAVLVSVALTVGASVLVTAALAVPLLFIAASSVARGVELGATGIAWWLVVANVYAAATSAVLLRIGARGVHRFVVGVCGVIVATCAPAIAGWTYRALGDSVRAATVVDCLFLAAIVVACFAEWIRRWQTRSSPSSPALLPGR